LPLRAVLEKTSWLRCFARSLETTEALVGARVKVSVALDRSGQPSFIGIDGVGDAASVACAKDAIAQELHSIVARMAGGISAGSGEWVLGRR
jgi:hypothetical protein